MIRSSSDAHSECWDEDKTTYAERLLLRAGSYRPERLFDIEASHHWFEGVVSPGGSFLYSNRIFPAGTRLKLAMSAQRMGTVEFDGDVVLPTLFDVTGPSPDPWMSLTPQEMITQRPGILRASGTVVIGGLGLGWFLKKVHDRSQVESVVLVESSQELLDWYGHDLCGRLPKVTDVICGDVYDHVGRFGASAKHLLDIWKDYGECLLDKRFLLHKRLYKHVWGWGEEAICPAFRAIFDGDPRAVPIRPATPPRASCRRRRSTCPR
jgi:hypothetical protein